MKPFPADGVTIEMTAGGLGAETQPVELLPQDTDAQVIESTSKKIRTFLYELAEGTTNYRSLHSLTEQVEHQYHGRFIVELIQNAHDALHADSGKPDRVARIEIVLKPDEGPYGALYVANDGRPFSLSNFTSLSQLGQSDKNPQDSAGNKGIGFRSVLEIADSPEIYSRRAITSPAFDGFCFSFSPVVIERLTGPVIKMLRGGGTELCVFGDVPLVDWEAVLLNKFRTSVLRRGELWLVDELKYLSPYLLPFPVQRDKAGATVLEFEQRGFATVMRFPLKNRAAAILVTQMIDELDASTMLFLDRATSLVLDDGNSVPDNEKRRRELSRHSVSREASQFGGRQVAITADDDSLANQYWLWTKNLSVADASDEFRQAVLELPGKWPELKELAVSIAVRLGDDPGSGIFSIFLPTLLETGCAAHINAPFFGNMSRTDIDFKKTYNKLLVDEAATLAVSVVAHELAGRGADEARAVVDLISPLSATDEVDGLWRGATERACERLGVNIQQDCIFLADSGWTPLDSTSLLPAAAESLSVLNPSVLRAHASFDIFSECLDGRAKQLTTLAKRYFDVGVFPSAESVSETLEAVAAHYHAHGESFDWNGFWTDADIILAGDSSTLATRKVLLGNDGTLHSSDECAVFFVPRQGSVDDEEVENEGAILDIPPALNKYIAFLSEKIHVYDQQKARTQTRIRKFLDTKLVNRFRVEDIFSFVLIPRTPQLPIPLNSAEDPLCRDILLWGLRLMANLVGRGKGEKSLGLLKDLPVPCKGGWYRGADSTFGSGWPQTLGETVSRYLKGVRSPECKEARKRLLLQPSDERWASSGMTHQDLLRRAGVFNGLRLVLVAAKAWKGTFQAHRHNFQLPEAAPPGIATSHWEAYRSYAHSAGRPTYQGWFHYEMQEFRVIPGFDKYAELDHATRLALMDVVLGSVGSWEEGWESVSVRKIEGNWDSISLESPLAFGLRTHAWLGLRQPDDTLDWCKPSDRWHVPAAALAGRAWQFAHLKPLPANIAAQFDGDGKLASVLQRLGMPHFDPERHSASTRLLNDLADAAQTENIPEWNVFLGQVRSAWAAFYPVPGAAFPARVLVSHGGRRLTAQKPTLTEPVYLPDSSKSFVAALDQFELPVVAIETPDARRLADGFKAAYAEGVIRASELRVVPLVDGSPWSGLGQRIRETEFEWLVPVLLTLAAFGGTQPKGTSSKRFREQIETFREARLSWASYLEAALFHGDVIVVSPTTPGIWIDDKQMLLVANDCRANPSLLGEALSHLLEREDLEMTIKLLLTGFADLQPERDEVIRALNQLKLSERQLYEVYEHWRGDLGHVIRMILPLVQILQPGADIGALISLDTDDKVMRFLDLAASRGVSGKNIVETARTSPDMFDFGAKMFHVLGEPVQLAAWNAALALRGEPALSNGEAEDEFRAHCGTSIQPLRSLLARIAARQPSSRTFRELSEQLGSLPCPDSFTNDFWEVRFKETLAVIALFFEPLTPNAAELDAIRQSDTCEDLIERLKGAAVDVTFDPIQTTRDNHEKLRSALTRLQQIGLAWALANDYKNPVDWENRIDLHLASLSSHLDTCDFVGPWSDIEVFALLHKLPQDQASTAFWTTVSQSSNFEVLINGLGLAAEALANANARLTALKAEASRQKKLVQICGKTFDSSEDNLAGLWAHICGGMPADVLDTLEPFDVRKHTSLTVVEKASEAKKKERQSKKSPVAKHISKSLETTVGLAGEIHAFRMLQKLYGVLSVSSSSWISGNSLYVFPENKTDEYFGCDFVFTLKNRTYHVEAKASEGANESFPIGSSEIQLAMKLAKKSRRRQKGVFLILRVANALSDRPSFQLLPNPYDQRYQSLFAIEEAGARVRYNAVS